MRLYQWKSRILIYLVSAMMHSVYAQDINIDTSLLAPGARLETGDSIQISEMTPIQNTLDADARQQLDDFVKNIKSARGQFSQISSGDKSGAKQLGTFAFARPGKFVWKVTQPFEQVVLSDGKTLYQYDVDLMQVTERPAQQSFGASPAAVLFGHGKLEQHFKVEVLPAADNLVWLRATPKVADAGMNYIDIAFANNLPVELRILDSFGKTTLIKLLHLVPNVQLPASTFQLHVPQGVDRVKLQ